MLDDATERRSPAKREPATMAQMRVERLGMQAQIDALQARQAAMFASRSWRITAPARGVSRSCRFLIRLVRASLHRLKPPGFPALPRPHLPRLPGFPALHLRPVLWTFDQYPARPLRTPRPFSTPANPPSIAMVTPAYNHAHFLKATLDSVMSQNYPRLAYIVKDAGSKDGTRELLSLYGDGLRWLSEPDTGQTSAINTGFQHVSGDIMGWLNSDDLLLPGALNYVAAFFNAHPEIDIVYGDRVIIDRDGHETGRAVLPSHDASALRHADYVPQETMFWRRHVWEALGGLDESFRFAMDWDFILRAQGRGFRFRHLPRFLGAFRVYPQQKTHSWTDIGAQEQTRLRETWVRPDFTVEDVNTAIKRYLTRHMLVNTAYKIGVLRR
jgi:glycosyltransferase involved in cell wall biosynthesis